jgi:hypothetical protein
MGMALCFYTFNKANIRDEVLEYVLLQNHELSRRIKGHIIGNSLEWKQVYVRQYKKNRAIKKTDAVESNTAHIIEVNITSPIQETFNMECRLVRLGGATAFARQINHYILNKLDALKPSHIDALTDYDRNPFHLQISGLDAKTRNQSRQYIYNRNGIQYSITYLTK